MLEIPCFRSRERGINPIECKTFEYKVLGIGSVLVTMFSA